MNKPTEAWRCNECGTVHEDEDDARDCCQPSITEGYICAVCAVFHMDEDVAIDCCADIDLDGPRLPTPRELEAAGQLRLLP